MMSSAPRSPKAFPAPVPDSSGIPHALEAEVLIAPFNDLGTVEGIIATHADELAAVIVEPFQRLIPPQPGFLQGLREITRRGRSAVTRVRKGGRASSWCQPSSTGSLRVDSYRAAGLRVAPRPRWAP